MNFTVMTLFPEMIEDGLNHSIIKRAIDNKIITLTAMNIREYAHNKQKHIDDYPYGGGDGMVMQAPPIFDCFQNISEEKKKNARVIYLTPQGKVFNQKMAEQLSKEENIIMLCGHYEGVDERVIEEIITDEISIGDFVLTGGELGAMILIDSISRLIGGVLGKENSHRDESFSNGLLEYPQYTRPKIFNGKQVPPVLLSGNHGEIAKWRKAKSLERTKARRPELLQ